MTCGFLLLFASTFLPIWTVWYLNPIEGVGYLRPLWVVVWEVTGAHVEEVNPAFPVIRTGDAHDFIIVALAFGIGTLIGAIFLAARSMFSSTHS
jgi:hypothetical protein